MKNREIIAQAKRDQNFFTFKHVQPNKTITIITKLKAIIIQKHGQ